MINDVDQHQDFAEYGRRARAIITEHYTWEKIVGEYEALFLNEN